MRPLTPPAEGAGGDQSMEVRMALAEQRLRVLESGNLEHRVLRLEPVVRDIKAEVVKIEDAAQQIELEVVALRKDLEIGLGKVAAELASQRSIAIGCSVAFSVVFVLIQVWGIFYGNR